MRKSLVALLVGLALALGTALAQEEAVVVVTAPETQDSYWASFSLGHPLGAAFGFGIRDLINNQIDIRFMASIGFAGGFGLGADAIFDLPFDIEGPIEPYAGGGPGIVIGGDEFIMGINLFAGAEYRLVDAGFPQGGIFAELGPTLNFAPRFGGAFNAKLGFNYHF